MGFAVSNIQETPHPCGSAFRAATPCFSTTGGFTGRTFVLTQRGERNIAELSPGDMIQTFDRGPQRLLAIGRRSFSAEDLLQQPTLRPVRLEADPFDSFGAMDIAPLHRFLLRGRKGRSRLARQSVLIRAGDVPSDWMQRPPITTQGVSYYHLVFDRHEVIMAGGIWCESVPLHARHDPFSDPSVNWDQDCDRALGRLIHKRQPWRVLSPRQVQRLAATFRHRQSPTESPLPFIA